MRRGGGWRTGGRVDENGVGGSSGWEERFSSLRGREGVQELSVIRKLWDTEERAGGRGGGEEDSRAFQEEV